MSRYRIFPVITWMELARFGPIPPSPHALLIYLRTNKLTTGIPGLYAAGEGSLTEGLMWTVKDFRRCWAALQAARFAIDADWDARVVFLACDLMEPNKPANPNVVKSWAGPWREIPSCPLKTAARAMIRSFIALPPERQFPKRFREPIDTRSDQPTRESFLRAFDEACPDGFGNQSRNQESGSRNQEQESGESLPDRVTGYLLQTWCAAEWAKVFPKALSWTVPPSAEGKAETFAERLTPDAVPDVRPTMNLAARNVRDRVEGWTDPRLKTSRAFFFGAWMSQFTNLREVLAGIAEAGKKPEPSPFCKFHQEAVNTGRRSRSPVDSCSECRHTETRAKPREAGEPEPIGGVAGGRP